MPPNEVSNAHLLGSLSKLEGILDGQTKLMQALHDQHQRRLDDLRSEILSHIDRHEQQLHGVATIAREAKELATAAKAMSDASNARIVKFGSGAGGLVAIGVEIIKAVFHYP